MKKIVMSLFVLALSFQAFAQKQEVDQAEMEKRNWFHNDYSKTGIHGVGTDSALEFLKSKKMKPIKVVVGVLDSGVQIDHEDLKNEVWTNRAEKLDGRDTDGNGYVDDIHGWDFCTTADGVDYNEDSYEATRVVVLYEPLFDSADKAKNMENMRKMPTEYQTYLRAKRDWAEKYYSALAKAGGKIDAETQQILDYLEEMAAYTKDMKLTKENVANMPEGTELEKDMKKRVDFLIANNEEFEGKTMRAIIEDAKKEFGIGSTRDSNDLNYAYNKEYNPAKGKTDIKGYGNNEVEGPDAFHGTHVAGIIGASRDNKLGMDGVAGGVVEIMSVRMVPDGDERDEDVANAIIYAVDNGAKILNMSFGKAFSPNKEMVWKAIQYADSKGVLMFHAAGNSNKDLDYEFNYPTSFKDDEMVSMASNWITVGASTRYPENLKASFSNYGTMKVDIFAPGTEIYSTIQNNSYRYAQGTSMASPVAAGCAALLWAYFPHLTSEQVKEILFETVNVSDVEVTVGKEKDQRKFSDLSVTGGVIDVNKAVRLAYDRYGAPSKKFLKELNRR